MISQQEIDHIKKTTDLAALIRKGGIELKRKGKQFAGLCPFHNDTNPSLIIDPNKRLWNCLGACGEGGDVYKWVMKTKGVSFPEAHALLSGEIGIHEEAVNTIASQVEKREWLERVMMHYHRRFLETPEAWEYLQSRGITMTEIVKVFRIGYADGSLLNILSPEGKEALTRHGLITVGGRELMHGCVVFPLVDSRSDEVISLYGRRCESGEINHLYLPGSRRGIFNPQGSRNVEEVIITESIIDACALMSVGLRNVIPAYGTNGLTDEIIDHLRECRVKRIVLILDSDEAGRKAAKQMSEKLNELGFSIRDVVLPAHDASEFITRGGTLEELRALMSEEEVSYDEMGIELEKHIDGSFRGSINGREYRVRSLAANGFDRMKVNVRVNIGGAFHIDTIDLYQMRSRNKFAQSAAKLCRIDEKQILSDLSLLIDALEIERLKMKPAGGPDGGNDITPMSASDKEAALKFLNDPQLTERIVADFKRCGLEGERTTLLTAYLASISRKLPEPFSTLVIARSGAGKSALQDAVCGFVPPEDLVRVTRLTGQALFYKDADSLKHKLLSIAEEEGASQASYSLRTLASDQHLSIAATRTDPNTGKLHTEHYEVNGPVSIIITTTSPEAFDEETRSRFIPLTLDESIEQTRAILERQRSRYSLDGVLERRSAEAVKTLHHNAQRLLKVIDVVNPYSDYLTYPEDRLILRREQKKYLSLMNAIALLHQYQRENKRAATKDGITEVEYVEVTIPDIALANELTQAALSRALDELAPPVRGMYEEVRRLCKKRSEECGCTPVEVKLTRREIREATGWSDWQVRTYCDQLVDLEYLHLIAGVNGKKFYYQLAHYDENDSRPMFKGLVDIEQLKQLKEKAKVKDAA